MIFNQEEWLSKIKQPLWYLAIPNILKDYSELVKNNPKLAEKKKQEIWGFFEEQLKLGRVCLGSKVGDFDTERKPIDTIVIHHTSNPPGLTKERLSAGELVRLYAPVFANPSEPDKHIKDEALYSGHVRNGAQVFYPYHWMIRSDGQTEKLLFDYETGWHSGDWEVNCRSVAIVFDNDYENSRPSDLELTSAARLIKENYPSVHKGDIIGHREVNSKTTCPSNLFLSGINQRGWKEDLLDLL